MTSIKTAYWSVYKEDLSIKYDGLFHGPLKTLIILKMPSTCSPELSWMHSWTLGNTNLKNVIRWCSPKRMTDDFRLAIFLPETRLSKTVIVYQSMDEKKVLMKFSSDEVLQVVIGNIRNFVLVVQVVCFYEVQDPTSIYLRRNLLSCLAVKI